MSNYDNIKPYAEFAHEAAKHGGVEKYLNEIAEANRDLGILEEKDTEGWTAALLLGAGLLLWEGGKASIKGIKAFSKKRKEEKKAILKAKSDGAKEAVIQGVRTYEEAETSYDSTIPFESEDEKSDEE